MFRRHSQFSRLKRRASIFGGFGLAAALLLTGCTSAVSTEGAAASSAPKKGGTLHIIQGADVQPVSIMGQNNPNFSINRLIFNSLIEYEHKTLTPQPSLATSWKVSPDGTNITFELQKGVKFHDGRAFTAADVIASLQVIQRPTTSSQMRHDALLITDMVATGDSEVTLTLSHGTSNIFDLFDMMPIIDINTVDALFTGKTFNGTGPFQVDSYTPGQGFKLSRNNSYWKKGLPYLDGVDITVVRNSQSMLSSLRAGQSELALDLAPLDASSVKGDPNFELVASDANDSTYYIASNVNVPLLAKKEVRQGISYAIDRARILKQVLGDIGSVTSLPWSPASSAYDKTKVNHYTYNEAKAKSMLADAGAAGQSVNIYYDSGFGPNAGIVEIVQFNLKQAGLDPVVVPQQSSEFHQNLISGGLNGLFVSGHGFGQISPVTLIKGSFPFNADKNASLFVNQEYKDLATELWTETDPAKQKVTIDKVNDLLLDQQFVSDLVNSSHTYTISKKLHGLEWTMLDYINLDKAYLG